MKLNYSSSKEDFKIYLLIALVIICVILIMCKDSPSMYMFNPNMDKKNLKKTICLEGMKSIVSFKPDEKYLHPKIIDQLNMMGENALDLKDVKEFHPKMHNDELCKIILKDKKGLRSFDVLLGKRTSFLFYEIVNITEKKLWEIK
jgi:hypothetical protein